MLVSALTFKFLKPEIEYEILDKRFLREYDTYERIVGQKNLESILFQSCLHWTALTWLPIILKIIGRIALRYN